MQLPMPRGQLSAAVLAALRDDTPLDPAHLVAQVEAVDGDVLLDEDVQVALWSMYELHYGGFDGVDESWEWEPDLLRVRQAQIGRAHV